MLGFCGFVPPQTLKRERSLHSDLSLFLPTKMVLSNKKLKQKLRATITESLTTSEAQTRIDPSSISSQTHHQTLKSLVDSATQKPRLSKREKRRKTHPTEVVLGLIGGSNGDTQKESERVESEGVIEEGKKSKKRKRERKPESGVAAESVEDGVEEKEAKELKKKKKKKKEKGKKEVKEEEMEKGVEVVNGGSEEQEVAETVKITDSQEKEDVTTKVYVGGIPFYSTEDDIRSYFDSCGSITEVDCMKFPESGKFRGIAIINFKTEAAAKRALALDGSDMGGLFLKIQPYKSAKANKVSDFAPAIVEGYNKIYVGNLSWDITEEELRKLFSDCSISAVKFGEDKETGEFRGYAHVDFTDNLSLTMALKLDQKIVCGRPVRIRCAVPRKVPEIKNSSDVPRKVPEIKNSNSTPNINPIPNYSTPDTNPIPNSTPQIKEDDNGGVSSVSGKIRRRTCYECGEKGHLSSSCPNTNTNPIPNYSIPNTNPIPNSTPEIKEDDNGGVSSVSGKIRRRTCYECGEKGHLSSSCPKKQAADSTNSIAS